MIAVRTPAPPARADEHAHRHGHIDGDRHGDGYGDRHGNLDGDADRHPDPDARAVGPHHDDDRLHL
jgi:hypothetical protein